MKGAIVGYGFISSRGHIPAYLAMQQNKRDVHIVAIADSCEARRNEAAIQLPKARIYTDHVSLLENETDLDFIDIATPPCDHASIAHAALDRRLHVLCEKPLTATLEEAKALLDHAALAKRVLFPCHNYKHAPVVKEIRQILKSGLIGQVRSVTLSTFRNTHAKGVPEWRTHWRREKKISGGGIAMDHGSHTLYLTFDWLRGYPSSITAKMSNLDNRYDTEDQFFAVLTFPTGTAHISLTWTAGVRKVIYTLQGEKGGITVMDDELELALMKTTSGPNVAQGAVTWEFQKRLISSKWMDASHVEWFQSMFSEFESAIESSDFVSTSTRDAFQCINLISLAYQSSQQHSIECLVPPNSWS